MGGEPDSQADPFWNAVRDHRHVYFMAAGGPTALWRLSLPPTAQPLGLDGKQMIEWGGAQRWLRSDAAAGDIRAAAARAGGHAVLFRHGDKCAGVFHPLAPAVAKIHRNLKQSYDPAGIFNPGRMYNEF
jgi:glycolate oxidase FAD binding subunit